MGESFTRDKKKNISIVLIFISIFIYLIIKMIIPTLISSMTKSIFPKEELIEDKYSVSSIVIKNEEVYKSAGKGTVTFIAEECEKVSAGKKIAELKLLKDNSTKNQQLEELNKKISVLNETIDEMTSNGDYNTKENIDNIVKEIQQSIQNEDYETAEILKEKLKIYKSDEIDPNNNRKEINNKLAELKEEKRKTEEELKKNLISYYTRDAGVVSYKIDGYEEVFKYSDRNNYSFDKLKDVPIKKDLLDNKYFEYNEPIFKIINNFEWHLLIDGTSVKDVEVYEIGDNITIEYKGKEIIGKIENIFKENKKVNLLCRFNTDFEDFYDKRFLDVNLIRYKNSGFKIPKKAIVEKDNQKGVYIKQTNGIVKFKPVDILKTDSEYIYISSGDEDGNIEVGLKDEKAKTVDEFDEILINDIKLKEGLILD